MIESVVVIAVEQSSSSDLDAVALRSLVVVCKARQEEHLGAGDAIRILTRQMDHARQYHTAWRRVEELSSAGI